MEYLPCDFGGALGQCKLTLNYCTGYFKVKQVRQNGVYGTCFHNREELLVRQHPVSPKDQQLPCSNSTWAAAVTVLLLVHGWGARILAVLHIA